MKRLAILFTICAAVVIGQQSITGLIPVWSQGRYQFVTIEQLRAALKITVPKAERIDFPILAAPVAEFEVTGAVKAVYRNGLLQREGVDYVLNPGAVRFEPFPTAAGDLITVFTEQ